MNSILHHITWTQYLATALIAGVISYVYILLRYFRPEIIDFQNRLGWQKSDDGLQALQLNADEPLPTPEEQPVSPIPLQQPMPSPSDQKISDSDILTGQLKACITKASENPFAAIVLINQLKHILRQHPEAARSPERYLHNHLIVTECENTGTALLTEDEVDQWWES